MLFRSTDPFFNRRGYESWIAATIVKFYSRPDEQHAFGRACGQFSFPRPKRLFIGVLVPRFAVVGSVASDPYGVTLEIFGVQLSELF
jgi:hypothetical protein